MKLLQLLRDCLKKWAQISGLDFVLLDDQNVPVVVTGDLYLPDESGIAEFRECEARCTGTGDFSMWKIADDMTLRYIMLVHGKHPSVTTIGELAVCQVESLISACTTRDDRNSFVRELLEGLIPAGQLLSRAKKLHINPDAERVVLLLQVPQGDDEVVLLTIRNFLLASRDFVTVVDHHRIAILKELEETRKEETVDYLAHVLVDALGAEAMTVAKISYSRFFAGLEGAANAFLEARTALEIGRIFYTQENIFDYQKLGIGRLIYQLPMEVCELFVREVFGEEQPVQLDEEILVTVRTLFENNLNMSETARQLYVHRNTLVYRFEKLQKKLGLDVRTFEDALTFHVAMMVVDYMRDRRPA